MIQQNARDYKNADYAGRKTVETFNMMLGKKFVHYLRTYQARLASEMRGAGRRREVDRRLAVALDRLELEVRGTLVLANNKSQQQNWQQRKLRLQCAAWCELVRADACTAQCGHGPAWCLAVFVAVLCRSAPAPIVGHDPGTTARR